MKPRVILADDHAIVLEGLKHILNGDVTVVATAPDGRTLVNEVRRLKPDVVITDISMPLLNGIDAFRQLRAERVPARFIFLTAHPDVTLAAQAFRLGAAGYVLKHSAGAELLTAVHAVLNGQTYVTPRIANDVLQGLMSGGAGEGHATLTGRERQVLQLLAEGKTAKEAGETLNVSPRTIEFHRNNIAEKTGYRSIAELSRYALSLGLVHATE